VAQPGMLALPAVEVAARVVPPTSAGTQ
jgi:hypothetical protein